MLLPLAFFLLFYVAASIFLARSIAAAPPGYEDEEGFHQMARGVRRETVKVRIAHVRTRRLKTIHDVVIGPFVG
jgi:hypothetical protein